MSRGQNANPNKKYHLSRWRCVLTQRIEDIVWVFDPLNADAAHFDPKVATQPLAMQGSLQSSFDIMGILT